MRKIRIFLFGAYDVNAGPSNVNNYLLRYSKNNIKRLQTKNKFIKYIDCLYKFMTNDVIIFSGFNKHIKLFLPFLKILKKKTIYLMHGCVKYEDQVNELGTDEKMINAERFLLENIDLVLCVSYKYMNWVREYYPIVKDKSFFLNSGIEQSEYDTFSEQPYARETRIYDMAVAGGNRKQKNNVIISKAVELLNDEASKKLVLNVYGRLYHSTDSFALYPHTMYKGMIPKEIFCQELMKTKLFIINSTVESFGLSAIDALMCGCSILITENAGITSLLKLTENDIIHDVNNGIEIADKIKYLLKHPNNERIKNSIDFEASSWEKVSERLISICEKLYSNKDYTNVK